MNESSQMHVTDVYRIHRAIEQRAMSSGQLYYKELVISPGRRRMDAWLILPGYQKPLATCYEIKCSRSDFLSDNKWHEYLPVCHCFAFVCPSGLIKKEEVPDPAGLYYVSDSGRMRQAKRPDYREIDLPTEFLLGIIYNRWQAPEHEGFVSPALRRHRMEMMRKMEEASKQNGRLIARHLRHRSDAYEAQIEELKQVDDFMKQMAIPLDGGSRPWDTMLEKLKHKIEAEERQIRLENLQLHLEMKYLKDSLAEALRANEKIKTALEVLKRALYTCEANESAINEEQKERRRNEQV